MRLPAHTANPDVGFQIAPMLDVMLVLLIFFMALAAQIRIEHILQTKLPGVAVASGTAEFVDEQILIIDEAGEVTLNDETYDNAASHEMPQLTGTLMRLKESSDAAKSKVVVTLVSHPESPYYRTIDVLNALAVAGITNVTFTADAEL
ncbi:biopolymer transporter ExbD [Opitutaceae bacterium TAV4]|uniref:ExbD/TolR family protein n=1 Tax=Geminisphaera colitermitum TaxID=1148786 RepID=UPI0001964DE1|nr:biopolymer transporter ExbD [Geminisphaera colitermitum]RRJ97762.1 biopolymer transporter ExbD [Opitutaceae bacterium TAV4]RRK02299.1 biopolymer transporter ExbD [Opitutaceae bacterium TAV3]